MKTVLPWQLVLVLMFISCATALGAPLLADTIRTSARVHVAFASTVQPSPASPESVFSSLGPADATVWRVFQWNPVEQRYDDGQGFDALALGRGYWLITSAAHTIAFQGTAAPSDTFAIPLGSGNVPRWYYAGNPLPFAVPETALVLQKQDRLSAVLRTTYADTIAQVWNPASRRYERAHTVAAGQPFWLHVTDLDTSANWVTWSTPCAGATMSCSQTDSHGDLHVGWSRNDSVFYSHRHGTGWTTELVEDSTGYSGLGADVSLALDPGGSPQMIWFHAAPIGVSAAVWYAARSATGPHWNRQVSSMLLPERNVANGMTSSRWTLAVDRLGAPHVVWASHTFPIQIKYSKLVAGFWNTPEAIASTMDVEYDPFPYLAVAPDGTPLVAWTDVNSATFPSTVLLK